MADLLLLVMMLLFVRNSPDAVQPAATTGTSPSIPVARMLLSLRLVGVGLVGGMIQSADWRWPCFWGLLFQRLMSLIEACSSAP